MRSLLLAAGVGSRLLPITATTPKCVVMINGRPLLDYWLELLFGAGIERVVCTENLDSDVVVMESAKDRI